MKVLILSCDTGEGHNSAAFAVCEYLKSVNVDCEVVDAMALKSRKASKMTASAYLHVIKIPFLFRIIYNAGMTLSNSKLKSPVYFANKHYRQHLYDYINENGFDAIITTHLFPAEALTALKRENRLNVPTITINTDYTCIPFWEETELDYYVIPHKDLIPEFLRRGIPKEKLLPFGIPVRPIFCEKIPKEEARKKLCSLYHLSFENSKPWYMIMSGSMGYGKVYKLVNAIIKSRKSDIDIIIICGTNQKLKNKLNSIYKDYKNVAVLGFCNDISLIMDACDVLFTKPGGLSSTEAAVKNIPIIHTAPIPGCETRNAEFFKNHSMSYSSKCIRKQLEAAERICRDENYRNRIIQAQSENIFRDTCVNIYKLLIELTEKKGRIS